LVRVTTSLLVGAVGVGATLGEVVGEGEGLAVASGVIVVGLAVGEGEVVACAQV
jgi:hypothetical protein